MSTPNTDSKPNVYQRFNVHHRLQHFLIIVSFTLLAVSGLPIKFHANPVSQSISSFFGGSDGLLKFHLFNGGLMLAASAYHVIYLFIYAILKKEVSFNAYPNPKDVTDFVKSIKYNLGFSDVKPKFDRYAWIEKFDYLAVFWGMFIIGGSGVFMWFPDWGAKLFPRWIIDMWRIGHSDEAVLAVVVIVVWHFYNVHFNPNVFPYNNTWWDGNMSEKIMKDEHPVELERIKAQENPVEEGYRPWLSKNTPSQKG